MTGLQKLLLQRLTLISAVYFGGQGLPGVIPGKWQNGRVKL